MNVHFSSSIPGVGQSISKMSIFPTLTSCMERHLQNGKQCIQFRDKWALNVVDTSLSVATPPLLPFPYHSGEPSQLPESPVGPAWVRQSANSYSNSFHTAKGGRSCPLSVNVSIYVNVCQCVPNILSVLNYFTCCQSVSICVKQIECFKLLYMLSICVNLCQTDWVF